MPLHLQREVDRLNKMILRLGGAVEENLRGGIKSVVERDAALGSSLCSADEPIDEMEIDVEEECLKILALHQPVAADLRYIVAVLKINSDLERIGDLAVNMGKRAILMTRQPEIDLPPQLTEMAEMTRALLRVTLDALVNQNVDACRSVMADDDKVDDLNSEMYDYCKERLTAGDPNVSNLVHLLLTAKDLERIADHACNIAEDLIYLATGEIVRHGALEDD